MSAPRFFAGKNNGFFCLGISLSHFMITAADQWFLDFDFGHYYFRVYIKGKEPSCDTPSPQKSS
jgi:hypothetical protein